MYWFARAAIAKYHGEGGLNDKCFLTVLEAGRPKSRCWGTCLVVQCWSFNGPEPGGPESMIRK